MKKIPLTAAVNRDHEPRTQLINAIENLRPLVNKLRQAKAIEDRDAILDAWPDVKNYLQSSHPFVPLLSQLSLEGSLIVKSLVAIQQLNRLMPRPDGSAEGVKRLHALVDQLTAVEKFYHEIGGVIGYHWMMLKFLCGAKQPESAARQGVYHPAKGVDICEETKDVREMILWGLRYLPKMAEIYPLGGAGDRLRLQDEKTGVPLPAAKLPFLGKTLLEHLIADLEAREHLYFRLFGEGICTPIAVMTSAEKDNHAHVLAICEEKNWFGRPKETFRFFCQPLVPTVNAEGQWVCLGLLKPLLKPGGHGVIWKLARDEGIFEWLKGENRTKALVRQINNPIAGTDYGLLAFAGLGCRKDKTFGFASCHRQVKASEGVNVLCEKIDAEGAQYVLTNIEYCDFQKYEIVDEPIAPGSPYSKFTSNTNILFADLSAVEKASLRSPMPGLLINLKKTSYRREDGKTKEEPLARLESTMQNIADCFHQILPEPLSEKNQDELGSFITFNVRRKTISTTKREFALGASLIETPEGCFLDILHNAFELLSTHCGMAVPFVNDPLDFFIKGHTFIFLYSPSMGPLYSIIAQKIRGGRLGLGAELQTEIAELDMEGLDLEGSLLIRADTVVDKKIEGNTLVYGNKAGRCTLQNVTIRNSGIDREAPNVYWRNEIYRKESCQIVIYGSGEFEARDVILEGDLYIEVQDGHRVIARQGENGVVFEDEEIGRPTWNWVYSLDGEHRIHLQREQYV